jgi:hypothetical protein
MRRYWLLLCLLLCLTIPLYAQDNPPGYNIALQRIQEAADNNATRLGLSDLDLIEVPPEIGQLTNLKVLFLDINELRNLPPEIGQLINLEVLSLHMNQLVSLPPEIGQLSNLRVLSVSHNQLVNLPSEIGQLISLQELYLNNNQLTSLPSEIGELANLQRLDLYSNVLHHLPSEMGNLSRLASTDGYLYIRNNPLISPPRGVVEQGTAAVLAYLRNQAWYHVQRMIISAASGVGLLAAFVLGWRYRHTRGKSKAKRV